MNTHAPLLVVMILAFVAPLALGQVPDCVEPPQREAQQQKPCLDSAICDELAPEDREQVLAADFDAWGQPCRAYALMPDGWDQWTVPRGFFAVGRPFPMYATGWTGEGPRGEYSPRQALHEGHLGPPVLAWISGRAELWGCGDDRRTEIDIEALEKVGLCLNPYDVQIGSPFWTDAFFFVLLGQCDIPMTVQGKARFALDQGYTDEQWRATGLLAEQMLERLEKAGGYDLICVTPEMAERRREARSALEN